MPHATHSPGPAEPPAESIPQDLTFASAECAACSLPKARICLTNVPHDEPWRLPPLVQAEVAQQEARGLAMTGESTATVDAKLDEAWEIFTGAEATADELGCHCDRALLAMQTRKSRTACSPGGGAGLVRGTC